MTNDRTQNAEVPHLRKEVEATRMAVYTGAGNTPSERDVVKLFTGVGECDCIGCDGSGVFDGGQDGPVECVECKGTGRINVSI